MMCAYICVPDSLVWFQGGFSSAMQKEVAIKHTSVATNNRRKG